MKWMAKIEIPLDAALRVGIRDTYSWHRNIWDCFPHRPTAKRNYLTRFDLLEGEWRTWIVSENEPRQPKWCPDGVFFVKKIESTFFDHRFYRFDLLANPVKSYVQRDEAGKSLLKSNGKRRSGKRVPIVKREELEEWLQRKADSRSRDEITGESVSSGFKIVEDKLLDIGKMQKRYFKRKNTTGYHGGVRFRGTLEVTDRKKFIDTYTSGIGGGKAFGFGLLLLVPVVR